MLDNVFQKKLTAKNIVFFIVMLLFIIFITKVKDIAILFFAAYVLACSLNPLVNKLSNKLKRPFASAIVILSFVLLVAAFFIPLVAVAGYEIKSFVNLIPQYFDNIRIFISKTPILNNTQLANIDMGNLLSSATGFTTNVLNQSIEASKNVASVFVYIIAGLLIMYYFMTDNDKVKEAYLTLFPENMKEKAGNILETISVKIGGYVTAQVATMSCVGIIMTIGLCIFGIEYALLLGLITAILDIIPVVGPAIALVICLLSTYKAGMLAMALVVIVFAIAQIAENNLIRPYIFGKILNLHPLIIYLFLLITAQYLGLVGVIFAPAIAATVCVLIEELYIKNIN